MKTIAPSVHLGTPANEARRLARDLLRLADELDAAPTQSARPEVVTLREAARILGVKPRALRGQIRRCSLPATKLGKDYMVRIDDVRALLAPKTRTPTPSSHESDHESRLAEKLRASGVAVAR